MITGKSFGGCIAYSLNREEAYILDACGVRSCSVSQITEDFNMQRSLNPNIAKAVGHIILSWSTLDRHKLTDQIMAERAKEYMNKMKITDTQYLMVRHTDRDHPHLHLIYNRVNNSGKTITDRFQKLANARACKEITLAYGYHLAEGKANVNRQKLKGIDKVRYEMHDAINSAIKNSCNWNELEAELGKYGIVTHYKYLSGTNTVQGVSFSKGICKLKGSEIDRTLSYAKINSRLQINSQSTSIEQKKMLRPNSFIKDYQKTNKAAPLLEILLESPQQPDEQVPFELRKHKRKLRKGHRL